MTPDISSDSHAQILSPPGPNRAQRRAKERDERRKEKAKQRLAYLRSYEDLLVYMASTHELCPDCNLHYLGNSWYRCQCKVKQRHLCAICHAMFMTSRQYWQHGNICIPCAVQLSEMWENEEASRSRAYDEYYEHRASDGAQHREAMEAR